MKGRLSSSALSKQKGLVSAIGHPLKSGSAEWELGSDGFWETKLGNS